MPFNRFSSLQKLLALYTLWVYILVVINTVELSALAKKQLKKLPVHIVVSLQNWVEDVEERGLEEVRKIPGYHDEALRGELRGLRSIRLSKAYRAYYRIIDDSIRFVNVERIDKHEY
jgi:proteic killer suppression protein